MLPSDLQPASFRGVRFLVPQDDAEEGRNSIRHATPDSSFHYLEDNGRHPPEFKINAILHGPNLPGQWAALRAALTRPGPGMLKHPWYGSQYVMVDGKFRVRRDDRDAGTLEIDIPFAVTGPPSLPGSVTGVAAYVTGIAKSALDTLFASFVARYGNPLLSTESMRQIATAIEDVGAVSDRLFAAAGRAGADLVTRSDALARDPVALGGTLQRVIAEPLDAVDAYGAADLVRGFTALSDAAMAVTASADAIRTTTADRVARAETLRLVGMTMEAAAFLALADAMVGRIYATADDVARDETALTARIDAVHERELDADVHVALRNVHVAASEVLRQVEVRLPQVTAGTFGNVPASVLAYRAYGDDARLQTLVDLNLGQNPVLMAGTLNLLLERG